MLLLLLNQPVNKIIVHFIVFTSQFLKTENVHPAHTNHRNKKVFINISTEIVYPTS